ncbi:Lrp/AsnC family transcriptional regulator [Ruegeria marina]|uniref:Transcriptional regulator, AsnC family n=1 Tax=Ruegeria marina TaxID=639004 RepID=A0A1G6QQG7_9RHOB|nr:Lrp/AsnC family transcriptional regulator [Ruegeria marina]SDC93917.1 transcriptional regulator, AsnC family [Ruegeria marina]
MDDLDRKIVTILQQDSQVSMAALSDRIGLSLSACHRRVKLLESAGVIRNYAAQIDRAAVGLDVQVFIEVKLNSQRREDLEAFEKAVALMPEILECHMITGEFDFLMRVCVRSPADYEALYRSRLSTIPAVSQMKTMLSLWTNKEFRGFHLG